MYHNRLADPTFGICPVAQAMLALLAGREPEFLPYSNDVYAYKGELYTRPVYNGRENGIAVIAARQVRINPNESSFRSTTTIYCVVMFAENRNSDDIFVQTQITNKLTDDFNVVVTVADLSETSYCNRAYFKCNELVQATNKVVEELSAFYALTDDTLRTYITSAN